MLLTMQPTLNATLTTKKSPTAELQDIVAEISSNRLVHPDRKGRRTNAMAERLKLMQPSGPRDPSEGIEDEEQGIISIDSTESGGVSMRCTLLCAGFVLGPSGSSVRAVAKQTGADIRSETQRPSTHACCTRTCRRFVIEGPSKSVATAVRIISAAITHYKELCEGMYCGQCVSKLQVVEGVTFVYQPPPRSKVPHAASILIEHDSSTTSSKSPPLSVVDHPLSAFTSSMPPLGAHTPVYDTTLPTPAQVFQGNPALLRAVSSPVRAPHTSRATTPTPSLERTATCPHAATTTKPLSFFCYTPKTDRSVGVPPMRTSPTTVPVPLTTPFGGVADETSLSTAFGMATPLQRALQVALCNAAEQQPYGMLPAFDAAYGGGDGMAPPLFGGHPSLPLAPVPVNLPFTTPELSHELQGLQFGGWGAVGEEHAGNALQF